MIPTLEEKLAIAEWRNERLQTAVGLARVYFNHPRGYERGEAIACIEKNSEAVAAMDAAGWLAFVRWV